MSKKKTRSIIISHIVDVACILCLGITAAAGAVALVPQYPLLWFVAGWGVSFFGVAIFYGVMPLLHRLVEADAAIIHYLREQGGSMEEDENNPNNLLSGVRGRSVKSPIGFHAPARIRDDAEVAR